MTAEVLAGLVAGDVLLSSDGAPPVAGAVVNGALPGWIESRRHRLSVLRWLFYGFGERTIDVDGPLTRVRVAELPVFEL